ncbi:MAG: hypothetical protein E7533_04500 [Ruminococcaceae bacterium]|nr:hypothetical protein [Oscillospiraceae bacterium]
MKYLIREIFDFLFEKPINSFILKKSEEKEKNFDRYDFVAYHHPIRIAICFVQLVLSLCATIGVYVVNKENTVLLAVSGILSVLIFLVAVYMLTYRCHVDETGFTVRKFFVLKRFIPKEKFFNVDITELKQRNHKEDGLLIVKDEKNKKIFTASKDLVGFGLMCKMAKKFQRKSKNDATIITGDFYDKIKTN